MTVPHNDDTYLDSVPFELWATLDGLLEGVGHLWTYDANLHKVWCKDCDWTLDEVEFLEGATRAREHRKDVKVAVIDRYRSTLAVGTVQNDSDL